MTKKTFVLAWMFAILLTLFNVSNAMATPIDLSVSIIDPDGGQPEEHRGSIFIPKVNHDGSTMTFVTPCDGCELRLLDENGDVVYSIVIPVSNYTLYEGIAGENLMIL